MNKYINGKIKKMLRHKTFCSGAYITSIPGLTLLYGSNGIKSLVLNNELSIVLVIDGNVSSCHENDFFIMVPKTTNTYNFDSKYESKYFLACSLKISRHVLSLLDTEYSNFHFQHHTCIDNDYEENINIDLSNCFQRLITLMDKPEQIYVRAPIIICEIHYLVLISKKWRDCELSAPDNFYDIHTC